MYIHMYWTLFPLINTNCFTTFHLYVEIHFYTADGPGPCHWLLVSGGLVARIWRSLPPDLSLAGAETLLQAAVGQGHHSEIERTGKTSKGGDICSWVLQD